MGNTDLKTAWSPISSRRSAGTSFCRNVSYERFCTSMRFGISTIDGILPKSLRLRRPHWIVPAISSPESSRAALASFVFHALERRRCRRHPAPLVEASEGAAEGPRRLFHLHRCSLLLELLLHLLGLGLGDLLLHRLRRAVDEVLRFLEPKPGQLAHDLDDLDLLLACGAEDDVELRLLLGRGRAPRRRPPGAWHGGHRHRRGGGHAPLLLEHLGELGGLEQRQLVELLGDLLNRRHRSLLLEYRPPSLGGVLAALLQDVHEFALWRREHADEL